jgi:hypothetical protein
MSARLTKALLGVGLLQLDAQPAAHGGPGHDIHLTHTRVVVDGASVQCRIRLFQDDLQLALQRYANRPDLRVTETTPHDSIFGAYFGAKTVLRADGVVLRGRVVRSGRDADAVEFPMWWYIVELRAESPVRTLGVRYDLLFEQFRDQRNILTVVKEPDERHSLYFAESQRDEQIVKFGSGGT